MNFIERPIFLQQLLQWRDKHIIKVITGVRCCGKSTLIKIFQNYLLSSSVDDLNITSINFEDLEYSELKDPKALYDYIKKNLVDNQKNYIFLDEIQLVDNFPLVVDSLYLREDIDIYITGSNANMLSSELSTMLSGRYVEIKMTPLSFAEYVSSTGSLNDLAKKYSDYVSTSSFPYSLELGENNELLDGYLRGVYSTIVLKDIMQRNKISDSMMLESVIQFAADNIGNMMSIKSIADTMSSNGRKIDTKTVEKYLSAMVDSYFLYKVKRYNVRGKTLLKSQEKYYLVDLGFRRLLLGRRGFDVGRVLENIVFLELQRRYQYVYIAKIDELEIDFVVQSSNETRYYQVAATVRDERTLSRELAPFYKLKDNYPKVLLTLDEDPDADYGGILRTNVLKWLLKQNNEI